MPREFISLKTLSEVSGEDAKALRNLSQRIDIGGPGKREGRTDLYGYMEARRLLIARALLKAGVELYAVRRLIRALSEEHRMECVYFNAPLNFPLGGGCVRIEFDPSIICARLEDFEYEKDD